MKNVKAFNNATILYPFKKMGIDEVSVQPCPVSGVETEKLLIRDAFLLFLMHSIVLSRLYVCNRRKRHTAVLQWEFREV